MSDIKLTQLSKQHGCGAKANPKDLHKALSSLKMKRDERLLVGFESSDDAAIFNHNGTLLVQTVDVIAPIVDDPYTFGKIAAINSVSDIYAMGGTPLTAMSVLMYPCKVGTGMVAAMMQGGVDALNADNCTLAGGHTLDSGDIRLGFSITGYIGGGKVYQNSKLRVGDILILTKAVGVGLISTANKANIAKASEVEEMIDSMLLTNRVAADIMKKYDVSACTDVTGFGLGGHLLEMAKGANVSINVTKDFPMFSNVYEYAKMGFSPVAEFTNRDYGNSNVEIDDDILASVFFDPQTSGGLIIGVSQHHYKIILEDLINSGYIKASVIGEVAKRSDGEKCLIKIV